MKKHHFDSPKFFHLDTDPKRDRRVKVISSKRKNLESSFEDLQYIKQLGHKVSLKVLESASLLLIWLVSGMTWIFVQFLFLVERSFKYFLRNRFPKLVVSFVVGMSMIGVIQSYRHASHSLYQVQVQASQKVSNEIKAKEEIKHELDVKIQETQQKDAKIKDLEQQLQVKSDAQSPLIAGRGGSSSPASYDNSYAWGNCTWYVASKLHIPDNWGNANQWDDNARSQGFKISTKPKIGSIAQTDVGWLGHVAIVAEIKGDQVELNEMNVIGLGVQGFRWVSIQEYVYIYL